MLLIIHHQLPTEQSTFWNGKWLEIPNDKHGFTKLNPELLLFCFKNSGDVC